VFNEYFAAIFDTLSRRKRVVVGLAVVATVASGIGVKSLSLDNNVELMLPGNDEIRRSIRFLRESHFSDKVIISLAMEPSDQSQEELFQAVRQLEGQLGPPFVSKVVSGFFEADILSQTLSSLNNFPQLFDEAASSRIDSQITPEGVKAILRTNFRQLINPASAFFAPLVQSDPLGIGSEIFRSLHQSSSHLEYEVEIQNGFFVSRDHQHALLLLQTPIPVTDASRARELLTYLREKMEILPDSVSADVIAGHLHTISNEDVIKRDIWTALSIAGAAFILLFFFLFRDIRAIILILVPLASLLVSINLASIVLSRLSYFIVGMGGVVAGIAVDYGIHVYLAVRSADGRADAVKLVAQPVVVGALTTLGVFFAFFFSTVQGYHQLAFFSILSIVLSLAYALFVLPHFFARPCPLRPKRTPRQPRFSQLQSRSGAIVACWAVVMTGALISLSHLTLDSDITHFDGSEPYVLAAEQEFHQVWGGRDPPAIFVVPGDSLDQALRRNRLVYRDAIAVVGEEEFSSLSTIWPLAEERAANTARWTDFWKQGREAKLKRLLREHGAAFGFSGDAFSPFFENLYRDPGSDTELGELGVFSLLKERFVQEQKDGYQVLSFLPDEDRFVSQLSAISEGYPGTFLVSRSALSRALSEAVSSEIVFLSAIAALLIPILACLLLKDIRLTALSLVPVATGIMVVLGLIPLLGLSLNAPSVISAMVVAGLCIDYGIFIVYDCHYHLEADTRTAVTLSAVTTLIGTAVLLFARHPILFSIGVTMVTGVVAGYLSSMFVVPSFYQFLVQKRVRP
jgi:predicted exporter